MKTQDIIEGAKKTLTQNYPLQNFVPDHGDGCILVDRDGKRYLDFAAGIAVASLGHASPVMINALSAQASKITTAPASYVTEPRAKLAELLVHNCCTDRIYFCNSGAEAVEAAIKMARGWAHEEKGEDCKELITFSNSFHGRTMGAVSVTEKARTFPQFGPYIPGVHFAEFNDLDSVKALISDKICGILVEPIQGEGGITPATKEFMQGLRALCDEHNIAFIMDEIQAGAGRMGENFFAHYHFDVECDMITIAKGMGGGFPIGALMAKEKFAKAFTAGTHGSTYGGNPLGCAVSLAVCEEIMKPEFLAHVSEVSAYLFDGLEELKTKTNKIAEMRGTGLMIGIDTNVDIKKLRPALQEKGLLTTTAGKSTLRWTPPLIVTKPEAQHALDILESVLEEL